MTLTTKKIIYKSSIIIFFLIVVVSVFSKVIGFLFFSVGLLTLLLAKLRLNRSIYSFLPDVSYGMLDTGSLIIFIYIGSQLAGIYGAIISAIISDAVTDAIAGGFEGKIDEILREKNVDTRRNIFSSSFGKLAGCLMGGAFAIIALGY